MLNFSGLAESVFPEVLTSVIALAMGSCWGVEGKVVDRDTWGISKIHIWVFSPDLSRDQGYA